MVTCTVLDQDPAALARLKAEAGSFGSVAVDTETDGLHWSVGSRPFLATFCADGENSYGSYNPVLVRFLLEYFAANDVIAVYWNAAFDLHMLREWTGFWQAPKAYKYLNFEDGMHAHRIQYPGESAALKTAPLNARFSGLVADLDVKGPQLSVRRWIAEHTTIEKVAGKKVKRTPGYDKVPADIMLPYACQDVVMTIRLWREMARTRAEIQNPARLLKNTPSIEQCYRNEMRCVQTVVSMERHGMHVRRGDLQAHIDLAQSSLDVARAAWKLTPYADLNPASFKDISKMIYEMCGEQIKHRTEPSKSHPLGQAATNEMALMDCETEAGQDLAQKLLYMRGWKKDLEKLCEIFSYLSAASRVHTKLKGDAARTGRFSSTEPALQNTYRPDPKKPWTMIRSIFGPPEGYEWLFADFSQIELRLAAHFMCDLEMIHTLATGGDLHADTAEAMFAHAWAKADKVKRKQMRALAKIMNFAILYGAGVKRVTEMLLYGAAGCDRLEHDEVIDSLEAFGMADAADLPRDKSYVVLAKKLIDAFHNTRAKVRPFMNKASKAVEKYGCIYTTFGLRIPIPKIYSHKAGNAVVQGTAAGLMKETLVRTEDAYEKYCVANGLTMWGNVALFMSIHDETITECPTGHAYRMAQLIDPILADWPQFSTPIKAEYAVVDENGNWAAKKGFEVTNLEKVA